MKKLQPKKLKSDSFSLEELKKDILAEARTLRVHSGFAEQIADNVIKVVKTFLSTHPFVTEEEIDKIILAELRKYNKDLAYIYHNRDKII